MRQKHLCGVSYCCRFRIWNACHICSSLWPKMGECLVHLQEQCRVTAGASGRSWCGVCRVPASLYPRCHVSHCLLTAGTGGHHRLCSTLSSFVLKALRSLIIFEEGIFTGGCSYPCTACGTRVSFSMLVASSPLAVCSREVWAWGQGSIDRGVCSGLVGLSPHSSVTDVVEVLASTSMGDGLHSMWVVGLGGIWILKLSGKLTGTERDTSFLHTPSPPVFNSETKIIKILELVPTKIVFSPALFSG